MKLTIAQAAKPLSRVKPATREPLRIALVQTRWHEDLGEHLSKLEEGISRSRKRCKNRLPTGVDPKPLPGRQTPKRGT